MGSRYINRELSWLDFNARVLQEASNKQVPILERLRFIGIFSNNLDEFFQVRYATVKRIADTKPTIKNNKDNIVAKKLLDEITSKVINLQSESSLILESIEKSLKKENIVFINEREVLESHKEFLKDYFIRKISPALVTVILSNNKLHDFKDNKAFLIINIKLIDSSNIYALVEIPRDISRFVVLPKKDNKQYIMLIDDIIRYHLEIIFSFFNYSHIEAHMLKITRSAEFDIDDIDLSKSYIKKIQEYVNKRVNVGDEIEAVVLNIDRESRKMSLGMKQLSEDPWTDITKKFPIGSKHTGSVRNFTNFGVFIELEEGIDGLIYISDLSWTKKIKHPSEFLALNDKIEVVILDLDVEGRKLSLGHKQTKPNPWDVYEKDFAVDTLHKSEVSEIIEKGAIINFNEDISAFSPSRHLEKKDGSKLEQGESAEFKVIEFSKEFKRVVVSHLQTHNDSNEEPLEEEKVKEKKSKKKDEN